MLIVAGENAGAARARHARAELGQLGQLHSEWRQCVGGGVGGGEIAVVLLHAMREERAVALVGGGTETARKTSAGVLRRDVQLRRRGPRVLLGAAGHGTLIDRGLVSGANVTAQLGVAGDKVRTARLVADAHRQHMIEPQMTLEMRGDSVGARTGGGRTRHLNARVGNDLTVFVDLEIVAGDAISQRR